MAKKILPVNLNPYAKTLQHYSLPLSVLTADSHDVNSRNVEMYVINNFIQVVYNNHLDFFDIAYFPEWPCLNVIRVEFNYFSDPDEFIVFMRQMLSEDCYMYTFFINERYIPQRESYLKEDFKHNILVHGYEGALLYILGYCDDGAYKTTTISVDDFKKAMLKEGEVYFFETNRSYKAKLDIDRNLFLINGYLLSKDTSRIASSTGKALLGINACKYIYVKFLLRRVILISAHGICSISIKG